MLANDEQIIDSLIHRLQVFYIVKLNQESKAFMLMQVVESRLASHRKTLPESPHGSSKERYLVFTHICYL